LLPCRPFEQQRATGARYEMAGDHGDSQLRFALPSAAKGEQFQEILKRIGDECRGQRATRAMLVAGTLQISQADLKHGLATLAATGCSPGFKLACVAPVRQSFEALVQVEDSALGHGISVRVFFDEDNAKRWLAW
jgi:hypothetical protein